MTKQFHIYLLLLLYIQPTHADDKPWVMHTIDNTSQGADGVRLADVNGDSLIDIATGWEEGSVVRVYINPGYDKVKTPWQFVTVGHVESPEDAVFVDLNTDGNMDVISSCEGNNRTLYIHWAPENKNDYLNSNFWKTELIPLSSNRESWMFCLPMNIDDDEGIELVVGSKGENAHIGWLKPFDNPKELNRWNYFSIYDAGWIMSIREHDMNNDGVMDIVFSDRKGKNRGVKWLEHLGIEDIENKSWNEHAIGGIDQEVMFMDMADIDQDSKLDVAVALYNKQILLMKCVETEPYPFYEEYLIDIPESSGIGKAVKIADINLDGKMDIAFTTEKAEQHGVMWMSYDKSPTERQWTAYPIAGDEGIKFDRIEMIDLDNDGDLDLLTCEERGKLGVIWYENPTK
jgi:hypothetical protein